MKKKSTPIPALPPDEIERAWREMPFVDSEGKWCPPKITGAGKDANINAHGAQWAVGAFYAASLIGYLQSDHHPDNGYRLADLMDEIVGKKLDMVARGLLLGIGQYIATGAPRLPPGFTPDIDGGVTKH